MPAGRLRAALGPGIWDGYTTFCVERNPWDQVVSTFYMRRARDTPDLEWDEFIEARDFGAGNHTLYTDPGDRSRVLVDRIVPFEALKSGLAEVFERAGVPYHGDLGVRAKSEYRTDRRHYRSHYTPAQAEIVAEELAAEIALNGYEF